MREGETLVFVEVKLRKDRDDAPLCPWTRQTAAHFARGRRLSSGAWPVGRPARFDVVSVGFDGARLDVRHIENAFPLARGRYFV